MSKRSLMRRAWHLFRQSMARFSRPAFGACLRRAWDEAKNAPVTPLATIRAVMGCAEGIGRDELIQRLTMARTCARAQVARYRNAGRPSNWSAGKHRSADMCRLASIEMILTREISARDAAAAVF
ncbi:MAG: hypothetical protein B7Z30_00575 [Rhizobiales bacterium 12-68-15]|nr:MAG: hypothetical protein B7Z30_00575 [Rhizobiales bacterium 12-68-15]